MNRRALRAAVPLLLSALALVLVAHAVDIQESAARLTKVPPAALVMALLLTGLAYMTNGLRFASFMEGIAPVRLAEAVRLTFALAFSAHALGFLADAVRVQYLMRRYSLALRTAISVSIADRLLSVWLLTWGLFLLLPYVPRTPLVFGGFAALPVALCAGWLLAGGPFWPAWIGLPLSVFARSVASCGILARQVAMQIAAVLTVGVTLWILAGAMGAALPLLAAIAFAPVALLATVTPFTFAGLGAREAVFAVGLPLVVSVTPESAVALSLGFGTCLLIASLPGALTLPPILKGEAKRHAVQCRVDTP